MDGALGRLAPGGWTDAIEASLAETLGPDAVWLNATDLLPEADAALAHPLLLLRAQDRAVTGALETADPGLQAVISARYASEVARLTVGVEAGAPLTARLDAIDARQDEILERLSARSVAEETMEQLNGVLIGLIQKIDIQDKILRNHIVAQDAREAARQDQEAAPALGEGFQQTLGVSFAEFLARIEQRSEEDRAALRASQLN